MKDDGSINFFPLLTEEGRVREIFANYPSCIAKREAALSFIKKKKEVEGFSFQPWQTDKESKGRKRIFFCFFNPFVGRPRVRMRGKSALWVEVRG